MAIVLPSVEKRITRDSDKGKTNNDCFKCIKLPHHVFVLKFILQISGKIWEKKTTVMGTLISTNTEDNLVSCSTPYAISPYMATGNTYNQFKLSCIAFQPQSMNLQLELHPTWAYIFYGF